MTNFPLARCKLAHQLPFFRALCYLLISDLINAVEILQPVGISQLLFALKNIGVLIEQRRRPNS